MTARCAVGCVALALAAGCGPGASDLPRTGGGDESLARTPFASCGGAKPAVPTFGSGIDAAGTYVGQASCDPTAKPGVTAFKELILATYRCTKDLGIIRECSVGGPSEHKEGRAWDWGVDTANPAVNELLDWLIAADAQGNPHAMVRRFGIMYMIWNRRIWMAYASSKGWQPYTGANPHTDHVHFSFTWEGARKQTSGYTLAGATDGGGGAADAGGPAADGATSKLDAASGNIDFGMPFGDPLPTEADGGKPGLQPRAGRPVLLGNCALASEVAPGLRDLWPLAVLAGLWRRRRRAGRGRLG
ncbi:MAG: hypothetical protein IT371_00020 [Deltaproteobacteria bacterium]|nr:hypothetical protein [Deltaproteobacteria bacterium]